MKRTILAMTLAIVVSVVGCTPDMPDVQISQFFDGVSTAKLAGIALRTVHETTGWVLGMDDVDLAFTNHREDQASSSGYFADLKLTVTHNDTSLSVECTELTVDRSSIPTVEADEEIERMIDELKQKATRYQ